jgi:hypothetical protein
MHAEHHAQETKAEPRTPERLNEADKALSERLAVLAERVELQARELKAQAAEILRLRGERGSPRTDIAPQATRRNLLGRLAAGAAAALGLAAVAAPRAAEAMSRTNNYAGAPTKTYGLVAIRGAATDPEAYLPDLQGMDFGLIGMTDQTTTSPPSRAGVLGLTGTGAGVMGMDTAFTPSADSAGVRGRSNNGVGVMAEITTESHLSGSIALQAINRSPEPGTAIFASCANGNGLRVRSTRSRGAVIDGKVAPLNLVASSATTHPQNGWRGDLFVDSIGRLWYCRGDANWVRLDA